MLYLWPTRVKNDNPVHFLRPDCAPRSECPQFGMPAERRAQFRVPDVPWSRMSERDPFRIYEHAQCRVFERTSLQRAYVIPCQQQMVSSAVLRACLNALVLAAWTGVSCPYLRYGDRGRLQRMAFPAFFPLTLTTDCGYTIAYCCRCRSLVRICGLTRTQNFRICTSLNPKP